VKNDLLTFDGAVKRDPAVAAWFTREDGPLRLMVQPWYERMRACGPDVLELFHDGCPVLCVEDAPFGYVNAFTAHAAVGFFHGAALADPAGLLEGSGKHMRHVKLRPGVALNEKALNALIESAYRDICKRLLARKGRSK